MSRSLGYSYWASRSSIEPWKKQQLKKSQLEQCKTVVFFFLKIGFSLIRSSIISFR